MVDLRVTVGAVIVWKSESFLRTKPRVNDQWSFSQVSGSRGFIEHNRSVVKVRTLII